MTDLDESSIRQMDLRHVWHPYTRFSALAGAGIPVITRGDGIYLYDEAGRGYLDAISSWWACPLGHGDPALVAAIRRQAAELQHSILGNLTHPGAARLARALAELMPDPRRHVHFASDGASAVEAALKISLQYHAQTGHPERTGFFSLAQAYHGDTLATLSLGFIEGFHKAFEPVRLPCRQLPVPPYDLALDAACGAAQDLFARHAATIAALIVEPLCQGAAGMRIYPARFLEVLAARCAEHGVLLIADEIATGFGRTGRMFAFEHAHIDPDIVCLGKALTAGYLPLSATVVKDRIYETFSDVGEDRTFYHGHTFAGNPLAAAAACAALTRYRADDVAARARTLGQVMEADLQSLRELPQVEDVRCLGLIGAVVLRDTDGCDGAAHARAVQEHARAAGILLRPLGPVVYLMPPLVIEEAPLRALCKAFCAAVARA